MVASGFMKDARRNAERNLSVLKEFAEQGIPVLTACPSCELMFKEEIPTFFPELAKGTHPLQDAQEFLLQAVQNGELTLRAPEGQKKLLYHAPCHLRALGIGLPGYTLMRSLGLDISPANAGCCGISGSYGFKKEKHDISMRVGAELFEAVRRSQAEIVATECGTCRLQIQGATGVECLHPVSVIRRFCGEK